MTAEFPIMQPVRFYNYNDLLDWATKWPNLDNIINDTQYFEGLYPGKYFADWVQGKEMSIQARVSVEGNEDLVIYKWNSLTRIYNSYDIIEPTEITPLGWISDKVNRYNYTFTEIGVYYIESSTAGYRSSKFVVHSELKYKKRLIQIEYYNKENDHGMVFFDEETQKYSGRTYVTGRFAPIQPINEISAFRSDRINVRKIRTSTARTTNLLLTDLHWTENDRINEIFSCDRLTINGMTFQSEDVQDISQKENSDLIDITIKIVQTNYNYMVNKL